MHWSALPGSSLSRPKVYDEDDDVQLSMAKLLRAQLFWNQAKKMVQGWKKRPHWTASLLACFKEVCLRHTFVAGPFPFPNLFHLLVI